MKGVTRAAGVLAAFVLLFGVVHAGQKTEKFWTDLLRKYQGQSLACLLDDVVVDVEYTGEVARRDISDTERGGLEADRAASQALGSRYTTINRYTKRFAVLDEAGAAAMREYKVPYWSGQKVTHHSVEVVDRRGKTLPVTADMIGARPAFPDEGGIYQGVRNLVFHFEDLPVPCVINLFYTIEGEEAFGFQDRVFASDLPTYMMGMTYNFPQSYVMQNPWWQGALKSLRITPPTQKSIASAKGEVFQWVWHYKNLKPSRVEPYAPPVADIAPRVEFSPNFESDWVKLIDWYSLGVGQSLAAAGNERVLKGPTREALDAFQAVKKAEALRLAPPPDTTAVKDSAAAAAPPQDQPLTDSEKVAAIYRYVQEHYEAFDIPLGRGGFFPNRPGDVIDLPRIATKDLTGILVDMLRLAGIDADFAIVSTRDHGEVRTEYVSITQFNRAIAVAHAADETYFLDPTDKSAGIEDPPSSIEGQTVLVIRKGDPEWYSVPSSSTSRNHWTVAGDLVRGDDGIFVKKVDVDCQGEIGTVFRDRFYARGGEKGEEARKIWAEQNLPKDVALRNWLDTRGLTNDEPYAFTWDLQYPAGMAEEKGDTLILSGALFGQVLPVQYFGLDSDRQKAIWFHFEERGEERTTFRIPEGYAVVSVPDEREFRKPFGKVSFSYARETDRIEYVMEYAIDATDIPVEAASQVKEMFDQFKTNADRKIVLRKVPVEPVKGGA